MTSGVRGDAEGRTDGDRQEPVNHEVWGRGEHVAAYANRQLRPVEVMLLVRYRAALDGRVLELGCGAGRLTGYLIELGREVCGLDYAAAMVEYCRRAYPRGRFLEGDMRLLPTYDLGTFDTVVAPCAVLDVLSDAERRRVLSDIRALLTHDGLLIMSTHNRGRSANIPGPWRLEGATKLDLIGNLRSIPRRVRNHRRLRGLQREEPDYAVLNDEAHDFSLLHYYLSRDAQARQFTDCGFELLECLDPDGRAVAAGEVAPHATELHYVARPSS